MNMLKIKGIYEIPQKEDGFRILIDESWPPNLSREKAQIDLWIKEISPPTPKQWPEDDPKLSDPKGEDQMEIWRTAAIKIIRDTEKENGTVTFLCSTLQSIEELRF